MALCGRGGLEQLIVLHASKSGGQRGALTMFDADNEWIVRIHTQLRHHVDVQRRMQGNESLELPTTQTLAEILEVAFWASLTNNEGRATRVRLAIARIGAIDNVLEFAHPVAYSDEELAKLAPAAWSTGYLAVDVTQTPPTIWGISRRPIFDVLGTLFIEVSDPGVLRVGLGPFQSFVVFAGRSATMLQGARDEALSARLTHVLGKGQTDMSGLDWLVAWRQSLALGILARMILQDRHGGMLLVVPHDSEGWIPSLQPFTHQFVEADRTLREAIATSTDQPTNSNAVGLAELNEPVSQATKGAIFATLSQAKWQPESVLRPIAQLAAIDGAVVLTDNLDILGFGAMINVASVPDVYLVTASPEDAVRVRIDDAGGSRHQAGVRFVGQNHGSIALVISHEGHLSLAYWSAKHAGVLLLKHAEWWV